MERVRKSIIRRVGYLLFLLVLAGAGCVTGTETGETGPRELTGSEQEYVAALQGFSFDIFQKVVENESQKNIFISPYSINSALGMVLNGAKGETASEIQQALRQEALDMQTANEANKSLTALLEGMDPKVRFLGANSMWTNQHSEVKNSYKKTLADYYDAHIQALNFSDPKAKDTINRWVSEKTENRIPKLLEATSPLEILLLINTVYFKGDWTNAFKTENTAVKAFYPEQGNPFQTEMMSARIPVEWYRGDEVLMANLSYGDELYHMTVLMPVSDETGIDTFIEEQLSPENITAWSENMEEAIETDVIMPKFNIKYSLSLESVLKSLGITTAFDLEHADFSNISEDDKLIITRAFHTANITVDEEGTTASAATMIGVGIDSVPKIPLLNLNRPFVYMIAEKSTGTVLFMGVMRNPELE